jgi:hypothetical protein
MTMEGPEWLGSFVEWDRRSVCVVCQPCMNKERQATKGDGLSYLSARAEEAEEAAARR